MRRQIGIRKESLLFLREVNDLKEKQKWRDILSNFETQYLRRQVFTHTLHLWISWVEKRKMVDLTFALSIYFPHFIWSQLSKKEENWVVEDMDIWKKKPIFDHWHMFISHIYYFDLSTPAQFTRTSTKESRYIFSWEKRSPWSCAHLWTFLTLTANFSRSRLHIYIYLFSLTKDSWLTWSSNLDHLIDSFEHMDECMRLR
jgi:hypothetical protein